LLSISRDCRTSMHTYPNLLRPYYINILHVVKQNFEHRNMMHSEESNRTVAIRSGYSAKSIHSIPILNLIAPKRPSHARTISYIIRSYQNLQFIWGYSKPNNLYHAVSTESPTFWGATGRPGRANQCHSSRRRQRPRARPPWPWLGCCLPAFLRRQHHQRRLLVLK
jgi:hypothetical protein